MSAGSKTRRPEGFHSARKPKGDPRRAERQQRAYDRGAPRPEPK